MLRIFYLPQFTQDYDQVLAQAPHALAGEFPRETGSLLTLCWRKADSNSWFHPERNGNGRAPAPTSIILRDI
jgi:hypothetical protein